MPVKHKHLAFTAACGAALTFMEGGVRKIVLAQAGAHYGKDTPHYTIPGGFLEHLKKKRGDHLQAFPIGAESAYEACKREIEEELRLSDGMSLFDIDAKHFKLMDTDTLFLHGTERRIVIGMLYELPEAQVRRLQAHMNYLERDADYRKACAGYTINKDSRLPEIETLAVFDFDDVVAGKVPLLNQDQASLFVRVRDYYRDAMRAARQQLFSVEPTQKILSLGKIETRVQKLRAQGNCVVGLATGDFNRLAPSKIQFLNNAAAACDYLVVDVGSRNAADNTCVLSSVDAVIVKEPSQTILDTLKPDTVFSIS